MAIAPGFAHDLFISYAHADNLAPDGEDGWVTQFVARLEPALRQRLGGVETLDIYFDTSMTRANSRLPELLTAVRTSALFLAIGSPSYATRDWPRQELDTFVQHARDLSRLFAVEYLPLSDGEGYPPPLDKHIHVEMWRPSGRQHVSMPYSPATDVEAFQPLVHRLALDLRSKLLALRYASQEKPVPAGTSQVRVEIRPVPRASPGGASVSSATKRTVLLAQVTDDVEEEADQLRRYLGQYEEAIVVLPRTSYPQGGEAFTAALAEDLGQSDIFVQLLGRRAGRVPPDLAGGYTKHQIEAAKASGIEILQWRHPDLDPATVTDLGYKATLTAETVVAGGLEAFKRQVLEWARRPAPTERAARYSTVFINADDKDLPVAKEMERECLKHALMTILPMSGPSSEANRKDLADNLTDCDVLLFVYGDTTQDWIRSQLRFFSKIKPRREAEPKLLAIYSGPPGEKPDIGISVPNAHLINCPENWNLEPLRTLINRLNE